MSRYTGASCKKCRKLNEKLFLKGVKCSTNCVVDAERQKKDKKMSGPMGGRNKKSDYALHLREKQIARFSAQMGEAQFRRFFALASKDKGQTGAALLRFLEIRLDNIVRRLGYSVSLKGARQLINHGHVKVNGRKLDIASCLLKPGDKVALSEEALQLPLVRQGLEYAQKNSSRPSFVSWDEASSSGRLERLPDRAEVSIPVNEQLIVEFYSK